MCALLTGWGCAQADLSSAQNAYRNGNLPAAEKWIDQYAKEQGNGVHRVIAYLEQGSIRRDAGELEASLASFDAADEAITAIDRAPDVSLSRETLAAFSNLNALPYRGTYADRIMLYTLRALNCLELGDTERARVELRRAYERQREAVQQNAERLEAAQQAANDRSGGGYDAKRAQNDSRFRAGLDASYADLDRYQAYGDYANPFAEWLQGLYYLSEAIDGSDLERGRFALTRAAGMVPGNAFLEADRRLAERIAAGEPTPRMTWVVFATGTAPLRGEVRIDIPLFLFGGDVDYVGANFPRLVENPNYLRSLTAQPVPGDDSGDSQTTVAVTTELLADMDSIVAEEFKNELPVIITKTLIAAGTKAAAAYALRETFDHHDDGLTAIVRIATTVYQFAANQADLRTWGSLPKQYQVARLPTPESGKIALSTPSGVNAHGVPSGAVGRAAAPLTVDLLPGEFNVVVVRSINTYSPMRISQFSLGKDAPRWTEPSAE
ncbi:MAG: hypothetical protein AAGF84_14995 [Planctomycetota bacterium]